MISKARQWLGNRSLGQGGRIITAVVVMGLLLAAATGPLVSGLEKNGRLASKVSEHLVPNSNRVMSLVKSLLEAKSALEAFLLTGDEAERANYSDAVEMAHIVLSELEESNPEGGRFQDDTVISQIKGVSDLMGKMEAQAHEIFSIHDRPDNVVAAHLINTRGEKLMARTYAYIHVLMDTAFSNSSDRDMLALSALMGYQDSLSRMMSNVRGYMFMKEERFHKAFQKELHRNDTIYNTIVETLEPTAAGSAFINVLTVTRQKLLAVFDRAFMERDAAGWRQDLEYYRTQITPTLESLKWVLYTLSDNSSQGISQVASETMSHGLMLKQRTILAALFFLLIGGLLGFWIYHCVRVFTQQINASSDQLEGLSQRLRGETNKQALESGTQVEEIGSVYRTLHEFKEALSQIREQTEIMAQQTDAASLECVQGMEVLSDSQERMGAILKQVREISNAMEITKNQTKQMDGILAILDELVDQTKLLSFNATIEAAGAGASGTRFAMVAKHVRRLATGAQESTQEVRAIIKKVQETTENTRRAIEKGTLSVNEGENLMNVVTERLDAIVGAVGQVSDVAGTIFIATQAQDHAVTQVAEFVARAKETAERVSDRSDQASGTAVELQTTAKSLSSLMGE